MSKLSKKLAELIEARGESPDALARNLGVERSRLAKILDGSVVPNDNLVSRLARHFGEDAEVWLEMVRPNEGAPAPTAGLPVDFTKVAKVAEIADGDMKIVLNGLVAVAHIGGVFHAFGNICPHAGGPIGEGFLEGCVVECPWHAGQWDVRTGKALTFLATADIPVFEVRIVGEDVEIKLTPVVLVQGVAEPTNPGT